MRPLRFGIVQGVLTCPRISLHRGLLCTGPALLRQWTVPLAKKSAVQEGRGHAVQQSSDKLLLVGAVPGGPSKNATDTQQLDWAARIYTGGTTERSSQTGHANLVDSRDSIFAPSIIAHSIIVDKRLSLVPRWSIIEKRATSNGAASNLGGHRLQLPTSCRHGRGSQQRHELDLVLAVCVDALPTGALGHSS